MRKKNFPKLNLKENFLNRNLELIVFVELAPETLFDFSNEIISFDLEFSLNTLSKGNFIWHDLDGHFLDKIILSGGEKLVVQLISRNSNDEKLTAYSNVFRIYNFSIISSNSIAESNINKINIEFCSEGYYNNVKTVVRKGWANDQKISSIVQNLCTDFLKIDEKLLDITPTSNTIENFISPNKRPKEIIDYLKKFSEFGGLTDFYVFFENFNGIHFNPLSNLLKVEPEYSLSKQISLPENITAILSPTNENFYSGVNFAKSIKDGELGKTYVLFDRENKEFLEISHKMDQNFLDGVYMLGDFAYYNVKQLENIENSNYEIYPYFKDSLSWFSNYNIYKNYFKQYLYSFKLPINFFLDVGDVVSVPFKHHYSKLSPALTGNWFIMEMKISWKITNENKATIPISEIEYTAAKIGYESLFNDCINKDNLLKSEKHNNNWKKIRE